jgi:SAM-dependent methyltransferase
MRAQASLDSNGATCGLCGAPGVPWRRKYGFELLRCTRCRNGFVPKHLIPTDLESMYSRAYFEGGERTGYPTYLADSEVIAKNFERRLRFIEKLGPPGRRILDVGAAYGLLLRSAREAGWDASGVEIAEDCAEEATRISGTRVVAGDFTKVALDGTFDAIVMLDVIEHLRDPMAGLRRACELLSPRGLLLIETNDIDSPWARFMGNRWWFLDPPQHLFYFSLSGLKERLREAGFSNEFHVRRAGRRVSASNLLFKLSGGAPEGPIKRGLVRASQRNVPVSLYFNFGDAVLVAARKP